jgi:hypothetical protein
VAKKKIFIDKAGNVIALCDNKIENCPALGDKQIHRAADVEFNNSPDKKVWEIIDTEGDGSVMDTHIRRDEAIKLEVKIIEARLTEKLKAGELIIKN